MTKVLEIETKVDDKTTKLTNLKLQWNAMFSFHGAAKTSIKRKTKEKKRKSMARQLKTCKGR
jgi:hypothetical protein